jgi:hypothetical protein
MARFFLQEGKTHLTLNYHIDLIKYDYNPHTSTGVLTLCVCKDGEWGPVTCPPVEGTGNVCHLQRQSRRVEV